MAYDVNKPPMEDNPLPIKLKDNLGNDIDYSGPNLIGGHFSTSLTAKSAPVNVYQEYSPFGAAYTSLIDAKTAARVSVIAVNNVKLNQAGSSFTYLASADGLLGVASIPMRQDFVGGTFRKDAYPTECYRLSSSLATDNALLIKGTYGVIGKRLTGYNAKTSVVYIKFYDKATLPVVGDTPKLVYPVAPSSVFNIALDDYLMQNGWGIRIVTGAADSDTTAVAAGDILQLMLTFSQ